MEILLQSLWAKNKLLIKGFFIGILVLLLQIPTFYVQDLIAERETRQKEAIAEVSSKWAGKQNISGPMLVLPYRQTENTNNGAIETRHLAYFLPDVLDVQSTVYPQEKYRGIYKVMLYQSKTHFSGSFHSIDLQKLKISPQDVLWNEAYIQVHLSDVKGLNEEVRMNFNNKALVLSQEPTSEGSVIDGLSASVNATGPDDFNNASFSADLNLSGSGQLLFTPTGKSTTVSLASNWPHPSFTGNVLPQTTQIKDSGFTATWKSIALKRNFPQQWKDDAFQFADANSTQVTGNNIANTSFGADLYIPVNGYQKTMRSIKYAALCMLLTFASFFLIETTNGKSVHPFQYGLVGLALVLFYTLLLSFSEYIGFNGSYLVASLATIGLIGWFVAGLLKSSRLTILLSTVLLLIYTYVFTILQLQDYSLLLGSLGLFLALGIVMHFSKKIQW